MAEAEKEISFQSKCLPRYLSFSSFTVSNFATVWKERKTRENGMYHHRIQVHLHSIFQQYCKKKMKHEGLNTFYSIMHTDKWQWIKGCIAKVHIWYFISLCFGLTGWACKPKHLFNAVLKCNKADRKQNNQSNKKLK